MIAVTEFRAYAVARPDGWAAGWYDGQLGEDGVRLLRDGAEVLHVPPGTPGVSSSGANLTLPAGGGWVTIRVAPPPPADPTAVALGVASFLSGRSVKALTAAPVWAGWFVLLPAVIGVVGMTYGGLPGRVIGVAGTAANALILARSGWSAADRVGLMAGVTAAVAAGVAVAVALRMVAGG